MRLPIVRRSHIRFDASCSDHHLRWLYIPIFSFSTPITIQYLMFCVSFVLLNALRFLSVTSMILCIVSSWVVIALSFEDFGFYFFTAFNHLFLSLEAVILIASEFGIPYKLFAEFLPLLGPKSSLATLGLLQLISGFCVLGDLHHELIDPDCAGNPHFWKLLLATGTLLLTVSLFNLVASLSYRSKMRGTLRLERDQGAVALRSQRQKEKRIMEISPPLYAV
ncbi:hypothetical protein G7K_2697-t1 [Saitoella complicata NRRL Y-17804]|uniref:DUF7598 domain-containing protein n=1 Tax=Saitoella complicata (strain BCRC 22490 / CBS 7301 / JCM 7358 / NBRC 10748 / NRRL Y-17804) TaxID=698492 RepID=A0A0E9NFA6_SAICN|nr:hypothetical protein G7K_2697-t1 [Saitoella complicata NRRL Y-17804]